MIKTKTKFLMIVLLLSMLIMCCTCCFLNNKVALAATVEEEDDLQRGIMTQISVSIGAYSDQVWARAHNDFTLGFSTVQVYVYLYSSLDYESDYNNMKLENTAYISDLNINKTIETTAPINGVQRYWKARVKFKLDNSDWKSKETKTYLVGENGVLLD